MSDYTIYDDNKEKNKVLSRLAAYYGHDKLALVKFCLDRGHRPSDIARAMNKTPQSLSNLIRKHHLRTEKESNE